jgi:hypothetical protein
MVGAVRTRIKQNSFAKKSCDYTRHDPLNTDVKGKVYTGVVASP